MALTQYQREFISFLVKSGALKFGEFTLKSGRVAPYFINTGSFDTGEKITELGRYYAAHIEHSGLGDAEVIFGPAYKGVPLAVATASALAVARKRDVYFTFDRKEVKDHGDTGLLVGHTLKAGEKVVLVEDVITAGTTLQKVIPLLRSFAAIDLMGIVIAVDRSERGTGTLSAVQEVRESLGLNVYPIVTVHQLVECLSSENPSGIILTPKQLSDLAAYLDEYGVKNE